MKKKILNQIVKTIVLSAVFALCISSLSTGQTDKLKINFAVDTEFIKDNTLREEIWDACFILVDFRNPDESTNTITTYPLNLRTDIWIKTTSDKAYLPRPFDEKSERLRALLKKHGKSSDVAMVLARVLFQAGYKEEALKIADDYASSENKDNLINVSRFYHSCALFEKEIESLYRGIPEYPANEKETWIEAAINLINDYGFRKDLLDECYREAIKSARDKSKWLGKWFQELRKSGDTGKAEKIAAEYRKTYPEMSDFLNSQLADLYFETGKKDKAIRLYYEILKPSDEYGNFDKYFSGLDKAGEYNKTRRSLFEKFKSNTATDLEKVILFRMYLRGNQDKQAAAVAGDLRQSYSARGFQTQDLKILGVCYSMLHNYEEAVRVFYELYERAQSDDEKLENLWRIESIFFSNPGIFSDFQDKTLAGWFRPVTADDLPSIFGGIISLLYNKQSLSETAESMLAAYTICSSRSVLFNIEELARAKFPSSELAAKLMLDRSQIYQDYKLWEKSISAANEFIKSFPSSPQRYRCAELLINAYDSLKQYDNAVKVYTDTLAFAESKGDSENYSRYFKNEVNWLVAKKRLTEAVKVYWQEVQKHPDDGVMLTNFIDFVTSHNLAPEEIKIYKYALDKFQDTSFIHKIARWYIRQKQWKEFEEFSNKIVKTFENSVVERYLQEFQAYTPYSNEGEYKKQLYLQLYKFSIDRFPFNEYYLKHLLDFYNYYRMWDDYQRLAKRYYYINSESRQAVLANFYGQHKDYSPLTILHLSESLNDALVAGANQKTPNQAAVAADASIPGICQSFANALNLAWFSYYEEVIPFFKELVDLYPDEPSVLEFYASLHRSLKNSDEAVKLYKRLADSYPLNINYLTLAGDVLADIYQLELAVKYWDLILEKYPNDSNVAKDVATIFWDYYLFNKAEEVILKIRKKQGNDTLFGKELAAIYESAKKYDKAIEEYIKTIAYGEGDWWEEIDRLTRLNSRGNLGKLIKDGFTAFLAKEPNNYNLFNACSQFYNSIDETEALWGIYANIINKTDDFSILSDIYYFFEERNNKENLAKVMIRKVELAEDDTWLFNDTIAYLEDIRDYTGAENLINRKISKAQALVDEFPEEYINALDYAYSYYQRREDNEKILLTIKRLIDITSGEQKRSYQVKLARLYIEQNLLEDAAAILKALIENFPDRTDYFNALADIYIKKNDFKGLVDYYTEEIVQIKKAPIQPVRKQEIIDNLRRGLISGYEKLGMYPEAVDQYIEIINKSPKDVDILHMAFDFARKYNQLPRLTSYYEKTSKESFKDYRWQVILAKLYAWDEKYETAIEKYITAIQNEPQMADLYYDVADLYSKLNKYNDAAGVYAKLYRISKQNYEVLLLQAEMLKRAGKTKEAVEIARMALKNNPPDYQVYFNVAQKLESWSEYAAALEELTRGIQKFKDKSKEVTLSYEDPELISTIYFKNGKSIDAVFNLLDLSTWLQKKSQEMSRAGDYDASYNYQTSLGNVNSHITQKLGSYCANYVSDAEMAALSRRLFDFYKADKNGRWSLIRQFAGSAGLDELEENILNDSYLFDTETRINYFAERRNYGKLIKLLESITKTAGPKSLYFETLSSAYRISGMDNKELDTLEQYLQAYQLSSVDWLTNNTNKTVKRFLELALAKKDRPLQTLYQGRLQHYAGALINYLLGISRTDDAVKVLEANPLGKPLYWLKGKKAQILTRISKFDAGLASDLKKILNINPVKALAGKKPSSDIKSDIWYRLALIYGRFISLSQNPGDSDLYIPAAIEEQPKSADKQILTGDIYLELGKYDKAAEHFRFALQLEPANKRAISNLGKALLKAGKKDEALKTWGELIKSNLISDYELYMNVLIDNGFPDKGISAYLKRLNEAIDKMEYPDEILFYLNLAKSKASEYKVQFAPQEYVRKIYQTRQTDFKLINDIIDSKGLLDEPEKTFYYQKILELLASSAQTTVAVNEEWRKRYYNHLVSISNFKDALAYLEKLASADSDFKYIWIPSEMIKIRNRLKIEPIIPLVASKYIEKNGDIAYSDFISMLKTEKQDKLRNQLALELYDKRVNKAKSINNENLSNLAVELFTAGKTKEAESVIRRLLTYKTDNPEGMDIAASILEKFDLTERALEIRNNLEKIAPEDSKNMLAILQLRVKLKQHKEAIDIAEKLLTSKAVEREIKDKTANFIISKIKEGDSFQSPVTSHFDQFLFKKGVAPNENIYMILAASAMKSNNNAKAKELLSRSKKMLVKTIRSSLMLAEIYEKEGVIDSAIEEYKLALNRMQSKQKILTKLFELYCKKGDYMRAIKMTEDFDYFPEPNAPLGQMPDKFVQIHTSYTDVKDQLELLKKMETAALKINSLSRASYYHSLMLPLIENDPELLKSWNETNLQYTKQYAELMKKEKEALRISWEL